MKLGYRKDTNQHYAIKIHKPNDPNFNPETIGYVMTELDTITQLKHPNIINIVEYINESEVVKENGTTYPVVCVIVEEIATNGEMYFYVANTGPFSEATARYFFKQLIDGLDYMH